MNRRNRRAAPELPVNSLYTRTPPESEWVGRQVATMTAVESFRHGTIRAGTAFTIERKHVGRRAYRLSAGDGRTITMRADDIRRPSLVGFLHKRESSNEAE